MNYSSNKDRPSRLTDSFGRTHEYLRISVTERCNLRCRYCMPPEGVPLKPRDELLTFAEIETLARIFVGMGIRKIRITGGEPLVRRGVTELCTTLGSIEGVQSLAITTNGVRLEEHIDALKHAGLTNINISLDTLRPERFNHITLRNEHAAVLRGIESALRAEIPSIKINTVVVKGFNDDELGDFVEFARALSLNIRFIEYMPFLGNGWSEGACMPAQAMHDALAAAYTLLPVHSSELLHGPAKEYRVADSTATVGFITTMSDQFCGSCNRVRLTADGKLRNCLFAQDGTDLKTLLRNGATNTEIEDAIVAAIMPKWEKHPDAAQLISLQDRAMVSIGG